MRRGREGGEGGRGRKRREEGARGGGSQVAQEEDSFRRSLSLPFILFRDLALTRESESTDGVETE